MYTGWFHSAVLVKLVSFLRYMCFSRDVPSIVANISGVLEFDYYFSLVICQNLESH